METIKYIQSKNYTGIDDIQELRKDFYNNNICVSYENILQNSKELSPSELTTDENLNNKSRRLIFTCVKNTRNKNFDNIALECNGLILEAPSMKPLVLPCFSFKTNIDFGQTSQWMQDGLYNCYYLLDATVLSLYWYGDSWIIASARGFDMNKVQAVQTPLKTWETLFSEVLSEKQTNWTDFTSQLDQTNCYTFALQHIALNPFQNQNELYFIQYVNLSTFEVSRKNQFKLPMQTEVKNKTLQAMCGNLDRALNSWSSNKDYHPLMGYLLISNNPEITKNHSYIVLESSLLRRIRQLIYDKSYTELARKYGYDRFQVAAVSSYLSENKSVFLNLFPQYADVYQKLDKVQDELVNKVADRFAQTDDSKSFNAPNELIPSVMFSDILAEDLSKKITLQSPQDEKSKRQIQTFITNKKYLKQYYVECFSDNLQKKE